MDGMAVVVHVLSVSVLRIGLCVLSYLFSLGNVGMGNWDFGLGLTVWVFVNNSLLSYLINRFLLASRCTDQQSIEKVIYRENRVLSSINPFCMNIVVLRI